VISPLRPKRAGGAITRTIHYRDSRYSLCVYGYYSHYSSGTPYAPPPLPRGGKTSRPRKGGEGGGGAWNGRYGLL